MVDLSITRLIMKKSILFVLAFLAIVNIQAQQRKWTLHECVVHALENNISIKQSELDVEAAELNRRDAIGNFIPNINLNATNAWNTGLTQNVTTGILQTQTTRNFSAGATASLVLVDGLRNFRQIQRAKLSQLAGQYSLELMKDNIALFVANSYLQVLFNKQNLEVLRSQIEVTVEQRNRTRDLVEAGVVPEGDLLEIEATYANEMQRIIVAENNIRISLISLAQTLLIKDYENFDIVEDGYDVFGSEILTMSPNELVRKAREERNEIKVAEANLDLAETDIQLARGAYWPTLAAFFNYNTRESGMGRITGMQLDPDEPNRQIGVVQSTGDIVVAPNTIATLGNPLPFFRQLSLNDGITYGIQLNVPVLNGFSTRNQVQRSRINAERAAYNLEQAELDLEANVYQAYVDAQGAFEAYEAALIAVAAQERANQYATERFDVGLTNAFDYSQSKVRLENAQTEVIRAKYDYIFKLKVIELYFGIPATELKF